MAYRMLADLLVVAHAAFVVFALLGAILVVRWRWLALIHLPAVAWAVLVEVNHWSCPLTSWEFRLRAWAGDAGYAGGFIAHYLTAVLYPAGLTPSVQMLLGVAVLGVNGVLYGWLLYRCTRAPHAPRGIPPRSRSARCAVQPHDPAM